MKKQEKSILKKPKEKEKSNLPDNEFKEAVIRILTKLKLTGGT